MKIFRAQRPHHLHWSLWICKWPLLQGLELSASVTVLWSKRCPYAERGAGLYHFISSWDRTCQFFDQSFKYEHDVWAVLKFWYTFISLIKSMMKSVIKIKCTLPSRLSFSTLRIMNIEKLDVDFFPPYARTPNFSIHIKKILTKKVMDLH